MVPMMAATAIATAVARYVDGYSIYSARLPAGQGTTCRKSSRTDLNFLWFSSCQCLGGTFVTSTACWALVPTVP